MIGASLHLEAWEPELVDNDVAYNYIGPRSCAKRDRCSTVGPVGNYAALPDLAKWLLSFGMLLGRLEILTVIVLFAPAFWRA